MPEVVGCLQNVAQKLEQAQQDPRHARKLIAAAQAWLLLASGLLQVEFHTKRIRAKVQ